MPRKQPVRLTASTRSQSARVVCSKVTPRSETPALLTSTLSPPHCALAKAATACQSSSLVTSSLRKSHWPPAARISLASASPSSSTTSPITTWAPLSANSFASAAPCPRLPPVMSTVLLVNCGTAFPLRHYRLMEFEASALTMVARTVNASTVPSDSPFSKSCAAWPIVLVTWARHSTDLPRARANA